MKILYPKFGRHPCKGRIDIRWKYSGDRSFCTAFGPVSWKSLWRAVKWFCGRRCSMGISVIRRSTKQELAENIQ